MYFRNYRLPKNFVRPLTKKRRFGISFDSQHVKVSQTLVKTSSEHFYNIFPSFCGEMIWKISPICKFEMIGVFVNTWTPDCKYPVTDCENFQFLNQMKLS